MQATMSSICGAAVCWLMILASADGADDPNLAREFRAAKAGIMQQLRDRQTEVRVAAIRKLADYPMLDAAKLLMLQGLTSEHEDVRHAAFQTLVTFRGEEEVCTYLRTEVTRALKQRQPEFKTAAALGVLLASEIPAIQTSAEQLLDRVSQAAGGPALLVALVDELALLGDESSLKLLVKIDKLPTYPSQFGPRRALVQALIRIRRHDAVTALIQKLPGVQGEVRADILKHLTHLRGDRLEGDEAWREWWEGARETFQFPAADQQPAAAPVVANKVATYYGIPLYGARIVFVLDTSSSMKGTRIVAAQRELAKAIGELPESAQFNILVFNTVVVPWQGQLVPSSKENKQRATQFVLGQLLGSKTASYDALEAALSFDTESIYFVTDGAPTAGKLTRPDEIVVAAKRLNHLRRITINSIGVGVGAEGNPFDRFLKKLAQDHFGTYRRVEE
jgi:hypothetical protein